MRHGTSRANAEGIIVSHPDRGVPAYGLTEDGKRQTHESAAQAKTSGLLDTHTIIISSDFARAAETADIAAEVLGVPHTTLTPKLRERFFGAFDGTENTNYEKVWADDHHDAEHKNNGVESVEEVKARALGLIHELEQKYEGENYPSRFTR